MDFSAVKQFMDFMAENRTPGNAIEIYLGGHKVFDYVSGYSDFENKIPLSGKENYFIYSCSKIATATAGMQLIERGKILATDSLYSYIPEFSNVRVKCDNGTLKSPDRPITIGDLFAMTSGYTYDYSAALERANAVNGGIADTHTFVRCLADTPLAFSPGEHWQYGLSHDILAEVIAVVSGMDFSDYVTKNIFEPLEMANSTYRLTDDVVRNMAEQYTFVPDDCGELDPVAAQISGNAESGTFKNIGKSNYLVFSDRYDSGGAGIITTVSDYAKLAAALANYGTGVNGAKILSRRSVELLKSNRLTKNQMRDFSWEHLAGYGYGYGIRTMMNPALGGSLSSVGEFGWGGAAGSSMWVDNSLNLGVFYAQHCLNPREQFYQPRLRNIIYSCL